MLDNKTKQKIQKLLARSDSPHEGEAKTALKMAVKLMAKHNVSESDVHSDPIITKVIEHSKVKLTKAESKLSFYIAKAFGVYLCYRQGSYGRKCKLLFSGTEGDIEIAVYMFEVLSKKINKQALKWKSESGYTTSYVNEYKYGLSINIGQRMLEASQESSNEMAGEGLIHIDDRYSKAKTMYQADNNVNDDKRSQSRGYCMNQGLIDGNDISINRGVNGEQSQQQLLN